MKISSQFILLALFGAVTAAAAAEAPALTLNGVFYPDKKVEVKFSPTERVEPKATMSAAVESGSGQVRLTVSYSRTTPAVLFGGQVNAWVLWAISRDGVATNLGELPVGEGRSGQVSYTTSLNNIALILTAEPVTFVRRPSDLVGFTSLPCDDRLARNETFSFSSFRTLATGRDVESVAGLQLEEKTPVVLLQARRAVELLDAYGADEVAPKTSLEARTALAQANDANERRVGTPKDVPEAARRAITLASESLRDVVRKMEADAEAQRQAELDALGKRADTAEQARAATAATLADVERQRQALQGETERLAAERAAIARQRDALAQRLSGALGEVARTNQTARGLVVSLSGEILFDTGKSDLKPGAQITLAKLAGILMMMEQSKILIEGHTDTTGSADVNEKLSLARAQSVMSFLTEQGVERDRMSAVGLGSKQPVADNDTAENRAKNRRVEVVLAG